MTIHLHTTLQRPGPQGPGRVIPLELADGSQVMQVLEALEIPLDPENLLLVVNGRWAEVDQVLHAGDKVHLIPAISGGNH